MGAKVVPVVLHGNGQLSNNGRWNSDSPEATLPRGTLYAELRDASATVSGNNSLGSVYR